ncbi:hypothetical protein HY407_03270 [Candidatus Gottesmanbacteria bacterium]|nr:hypothetical protein [Candidatus Gottesmanbacteria bacterium]
MFKLKGGRYWFSNGWNWPGIAALIGGTIFYWMIAYAFPQIRQNITAALPTIVFVALIYRIGMSRLE